MTKLRQILLLVGLQLVVSIDHGFATEQQLSRTLIKKPLSPKLSRGAAAKKAVESRGRKKVSAAKKAVAVKKAAVKKAAGKRAAGKKAIVKKASRAKKFIQRPKKGFVGVPIRRGGPRRVLPFVSLGNMRPEGITRAPGRANVYTSEVFFGGIKRVNLVTGEVTQAVPSMGFGERASLGLWYYKGAILAAGAGPLIGLEGGLHFYDASTGEEIVTCVPDFDFGLMNDVTVVNGVAYVTDTINPNLIAIDADAAISNGECIISSISLPAEAFTSLNGLDDGRANGIAPFKYGVIIATLSPAGGGFYYIPNLNLPGDDPSAVISIGGGTGDGISIEGNLLYANSGEAIDVYSLNKLKGGTIMAQPIGILNSTTFDSPTTNAILGRYLATVNSLFATVPAPAPEEADPAFDATFSVVTVDRNQITRTG